MAPKTAMKKKCQSKKNKPTKKSAKLISKPVIMDSDEHDSDGNDDSDGSLNAIEFDSELYIIDVIV